MAFPTGTAEQTIQDAVAQAKTGDTFAFGSGTFALTNTLTITQKNITLKGMGMNATTLDFKKLSRSGSGSGIDALDGADGFLVHDFAVRDTLKNGIKVKGSQNVAFQHVKVSWTAADAGTHGDYALYPVFCKHVLVEDSDISGSSDAGIYVGQSKTTVVRRHSVHDNVAGIEIENSFDADVYDNM